MRLALPTSISPSQSERPFRGQSHSRCYPRAWWKSIRHSADTGTSSSETASSSWMTTGGSFSSLMPEDGIALLQTFQVERAVRVCGAGSSGLSCLLSGSAGCGGERRLLNSNCSNRQVKELGQLLYGLNPLLFRQLQCHQCSGPGCVEQTTAPERLKSRRNGAGWRTLSRCRATRQGGVQWTIR
jgi:hypothetical protein